MAKLRTATTYNELWQFYNLEPDGVYKVQVSMFKGNPWFEALLIVGFVDDDGKPMSYTHLVDRFGEELDMEKAMYASIHKIASINDCSKCHLPLNN